MTKARSLRSHNFIFVLTLFALGLLPYASRAQNVQYTNNTADSNLRGSLQVDPSTLGMSFNLPMGAYGGRGATLPISLTYSSKMWRMQHHFGWQSGVSYFNQIKAMYGEKSVSGWAASTDAPYIEFTGASEVYDEYGGSACLGCSPGYEGTIAFINRVLLHLPDGSTHELRKDDNVYYYNQPALSGVYVAVDGSRIKYDADTATVYLPDGARYWLTAPNGVQYIDRNGNTLTYNTTNKQWTDTLGRVINALALSNAATGDITHTIPGVNGVNQQFIFRWRRIGDTGVRTDSGQALRFKGDRNYGITNPQVLSPALFTSNGNDRVIDFGGAGNEFNPIVLHEIQLPNGSLYKFTYNVWGEVDKVLLPSGGYERFEYAEVPPLSDVTVPYSQTNRGVIKHWISATGNSADEVLWTYASTGATTTVTNPSGAKAERALHTGNGSNTYFGFEDARAGRALEERTYNASNQMIRRTLVDWTADGPLSGGYSTATRNPRGTKKVEVLLDTTGNALAATTISTYDADLNEIETKRYDYVSVSQSTGQSAAISSFTLGTLLRTEETTYLVNDADYSAVATQYRNRNLLGLPTKKLVKNGAGQIVAATEYKYDEAAYPLLSYATVSGWADPATTYRGSVTTARSWNNNGNQTWAGWTSGSWVEAHTQYDQCGSPRNSWDGKNNLAQVEYTDAFSDSVNRNTYAYPTKTISPKPDASGTYGANVELQALTKYDYATGKVTWVQDANNQVATTEYEGVLSSGYNSLNRLTRVVRPSGGGETVYEYNDTIGNQWVKTRTKRDASNWVEGVTFVDKFGRTYLSAANEGSNVWAISETKYDTLGRANQSANPYRVTSTTVDGIPAAAAAYSPKYWTTSTFDALNRVLTVTTPDNAVVTSEYEVNKVTVTDQAGKQRRSESDALGRLLNVWEAPTGENYLTTYKYDTLDNLVQVTQGAQNRYFLYDSLKRLVRARNPEQAIHTNHNLTDPFGNTINTQWSLAYTYDNNSNLLTKTDSRNASIGQAPTTATYTYDALNRNTTVGYSAYTNGTAFVERHYDNATLGKGKFHYNVKYNTETNGTLNYNHDMINGYDAVGRPTSKTQNFLINNSTWKPFTTSVTYDLAGNVTAQTYPSNRTVSYAYDAAGRTTSFTGNLGGTSRNYATAMQYAAAGQLTKETFGTTTALYHNLHYNVRQQLYDNRVGTNSGDEWGWDRGALEWYYGSAGWGASNPDNNGNITRADHWVPQSSGAWGSTTYDYYGYDGLNRVTSTTEYAHDSSNPTVTFRYMQAFTYDQWGNRTINQAATTTSPDINNKLFAVDTATNRLGVPSGQSGTMTFDEVGNLILDTYTSALTAGMQYDAENKMTSAGNSSQQYRYNADGKRVKRSIAGSGEFWMVYGMGGELVAEYNATSGIPAQTNPSKEFGYRSGQMLIVAESTTAVKWLIQDHLGSTRMEIGLAGNLGDVTRHDYFPFGEEIAGALRSATYGYGGATNTKQKFTGYEQDEETGLDYAQARYMSSKQGRFTSVDPENAGADAEDPHSWNGYAYARSNPTLYTDPDGQKYLVCPPRGGGGCQLISDDAFYDARRRDEAAGFEYTGNRDFHEVGFVIFEGSAHLSYQQVSIDDNARQLSFEMRRSLNDPKIIAMGAINGVLRNLHTFVPRSGGLTLEEMMGTLRETAKKKGNFGMGTATRSQADALGKAWVGSGYRVASDGKTLVSVDGLKVYRPPSHKPKLGKEQANFEWKTSSGDKPIGNGHLDIK